MLGVILTVVGIYVILYITISIPGVQSKIRERATKELSAFLGSQVDVESLSISPFNQAILKNVDVYTPAPENKLCLHIDKLGAGINLWQLIGSGKIHITYGEIIGMDARLWQNTETEPINIQFIIDAFAPKDPNKPPTKFDLRLSSIIIRGSKLSYDKKWLPGEAVAKKIDFNHIKVNNLQADISIPKLKNDDFDFDIRRLALKERSGFELKTLSTRVKVTDKELNVANLHIELPNTLLEPEDISISYPDLKNIMAAIKSQPHRFVVENGRVTPSDLACFYPPLETLNHPFRLDIELDGDINKLNVNILKLYSLSNDLDLEVRGNAAHYTAPEKGEVQINGISLVVDFTSYAPFLTSVSNNNRNVGKTLESLRTLGTLRMKASGKYGPSTAAFNGTIESAIGNLDLKASAEGKLKEKTGKADISIRTSELALGKFLPDLGLEQISIEGDVALSMINKKDPLTGKVPYIDGTANVNIPYMVFRGNEFADIELDANKKGEHIEGSLNIVSNPATLNLIGNYSQDGITLDAHVEQFVPSAFNLSKNEYLNFHGDANINLLGKDINTMVGEISLSDIWLAYGENKEFSTDRVNVESYVDESDSRCLVIRSDMLNGEIRGEYTLEKLPKAMLGILHSAAPSWTPSKWGEFNYAEAGIDAEYAFTVANDNRLFEALNVPMKLLTEIPIRGEINSSTGIATASLQIPYIQQGQKNFLHDVRLDIALDGKEHNGKIDLSTLLLGKNDDILFKVNAISSNDVLTTDLSWDFNRLRAYKGKVSLAASVDDVAFADGAAPQFTKQYSVEILPSTFQVNDTTWNITAGNIQYRDKMVDVHGISAMHEQQFVHIDGKASALPGDTINISLRDIDLDYIFQTLRINYVNFGGRATGKVKATEVFTKNPVAFTDNLFVKGLKYNGTVLGDGKLKSQWLNEEREVTIYADIRENGRRTALVDGGIWVTRDSLSFDFDADRVNAGFMAPFFEAFASDISGRASGQLKLYGTFADVNLIGKAKGDSIGLRVNYTNTKYVGSDSVYMTPGKIIVPNFKLYDKYGNSGYLSGTVYHNYFHEPRFEFVVKKCDKLLCFDTDAKINPRWYGRIFGNGGGTIKGDPSFVRIDVDMSTAPGSNFTFVLDESLEALDYTFLTFTDKKKEAEERIIAEAKEVDQVESYVESLRRKVQTEENVRPSIFSMDLRGTITPDAQMTLVMDPVAGDNIVCRGRGAMNIGYSSENDDFSMVGKYTLEEGTYKFTLQDVILKEFNIRQGSTISFTGDPYKANLDIDAIYKVNTNIADLDKSFATDRELNRTNVPVDAVLKVNGELQSPEITFDIELPTLTQDVARKVKSIVSTDDMMSMQIIYLLALGRFYAPEYMSSTQNGGEFTAIASTTVSSQLSNMLSQISNNVLISPSFRSDKGDFSDFEFDLGLSSRFFNNRLLLNGNFGYRDKNTSTTTFIGDFDLEYLLNRRGNLRLKAYNHFNDQNYYLKSALTTQGIGILLKHDFNSWKDIFYQKQGKLRAPQYPNKLINNKGEPAAPLPCI